MSKKEKYVTFSNDRFAESTAEWLNDFDKVTKTTKTKKGETIDVENEYGKAFRKEFFEKPLIANGVDKEQAKKYASSTKISKKQARALNDVSLETAEAYMRGRNILKFHSKRDLNASIRMRHQDETIIKSKSPATGEEVTTQVSEHEVIVKQSKAPKCCKRRLK